MNPIKHFIHLHQNQTRMGRFIEYLFVSFLTLIIYSFITKDTPEAIDVYRGTTELQLNYTIVDDDTLSIDSTVIFKQNMLNK